MEQCAYIRYYTQQQGGGSGGGGGILDDEFGPVLRLPKVYQRGRGLGGIFTSFWKYLQPLLKKGANFLKDELIDTGADVLRNLNTERPIKEILRDRSVQVVDKLRDNAVNKINTMTGGRRCKRKQEIALRKSINKKTKREKSQMKTLAVRDKRSVPAAVKTRTPRILDIFT